MAKTDDNLVYAHSIADAPIESWEPLVTHLDAVAGRAEALAAPCGLGAAARAAGLYHDVGKAAEDFQAYIRGKGPSSDHSTAGAVLADRHYSKHPRRPSEKYANGVFGKMIAFAVAGHHGGLANGRGEGRRLRSLERRLDAGPTVAPPADLPKPPTTEAITAFANRKWPEPFAASMAIRMLYSCLVDADSLETERFYAQALGRPPRPTLAVTTATLKARLDRHLADLTAGVAAPPGSVNALRAEVLEAARKRALEPPGLFSLTVPTGGGKTLSSLAFALNHATHHELRRVIHVSPYTAITEQTARVFRRAVGTAAVQEHHSAFDPTTIGPQEREDDEGTDGAKALALATENWDAPIVVTTAIQFFESLFANRRGTCRKLHNIARSVVILDEAQTLPVHLLRPCLEALKELARAYGTTVVLCTATQPAVRKDQGFPGGLEGVREIAPEPRRLYAALRRVRVEAAGELDDAAVAARLSARAQGLCIVNTRAHAKALYRKLQADLGTDGGVRHLTTCLCMAHRRQVLAEIRTDLAADRPVRVIATSLIEAGVDISFPMVLRAMAGLESIAQAAGRCNREGELGASGGTVVVFDPADDAHRGWPDIVQRAAVARAAMSTVDGAGLVSDPLGIDAVDRYFGALYWNAAEADRLDAATLSRKSGRSGPYPILKAVEEAGRDFLFPFEDIAEAFRMIDDTMVPIIVPYAPKRETVARALDALRGGSLAVGRIARLLQQVEVKVPPRVRASLIAAGAAEVVNPTTYSDRFVVLTNAGLYRDAPEDAVGLDWSDPSFARSEDLMF